MKAFKIAKLLVCLTFIVLAMFAFTACLGSIGPSVNGGGKGCESSNWQDHAIHQINNMREANCADGVDYGYSCDWGQCDECGAYFDINRNSKITWNEIIIPVQHPEITKAEERPSSCEQDGVKEHYYCVACNKWFSDEQGANVIENHDDYIIKASHDLELLTPGLVANCGSFGRLPLYHCNICYNQYTDENGETIYRGGPLELPLAGEHTYEGDICTTCNKYKGTEGLEYELVTDDEDLPFDYYVVSGLGTATGEVLYIPATYDGKPVVEWSAAVVNNTSLKKLYLSTPFQASIAYRAFETCTSLEEIYILGDAVFNDFALSQHPSLKKLTVYGDAVFYQVSCESCPQLETVEVTGTLRAEGGGIFANCTSLTSFDLSRYASSYFGVDGKVYLADSMFNGCTSLTNITLPAGLTHIGHRIFFDTGIKNFTIPETVTYIGDSAFNGSKLESITIPAYVNQISSSAFANCEKLKTVVFLSEELTLKDRAFSDCDALLEISLGNYDIKSECFFDCDNLMKVAIGANATLDFTDIFANCNRISEVVYSGETDVSAFTINYYNSEKLGDIASVVAESQIEVVDIDGFIFIVKDGAYTLNAYVAADKDVVLTGSMDGKTYVIAPRAFEYNETIESVSISGIAVIPDSAFSGCENLKSITIGSGVTSVGEMAFAYNESVETFVMEASLLSVGKHAFRFSGSYDSVGDLYTFENGAYYVGPESNPYQVLIYSHYQIVIINSNTKVIADYAFDNNYYMETIVIPESVVTIGKYAFNNCYELKSLLGLPEGYDETIIEGCDALTEIRLMNSIEIVDGFVFLVDDGVYSLKTYIGNAKDIVLTGTINGHAYTILPRAFYGNENIETLSISGVSVIPEETFAGCMNLTSFTLGAGVTTVGKNAFHYCLKINVENVSISADVVKVGQEAFRFYNYSNQYYNTHDGNGYITYYVGNAENPYLILVYANSGNPTMHDDTKVIADYAFENNTRIESVTIPAGLVAIGEYVFKGCTRLQTINGLNVEYNINIIDGCTSFNKASLSVLIDGAYYFGTELTGVVSTTAEYIIVKDGTTSIAAEAFRNCTNLRFIYLPASVTTLGKNALPYISDPSIPFMILLGAEESDITGLNASGGFYTYVFEKCVVSADGDYIYSTITPYSEETGIEIVAYIGDAVDLTIPDKIDNLNVLSLNGFTFDGTDVVNLTTPATLSAIGDTANRFQYLIKPFYNCNIKTVTINAQVSLHIAGQAFQGATTLETVTVVNVLYAIEIDNNAFDGCTSLSDVTIEADMIQLMMNVFKNCTSLSSVNVGDHTEVKVITQMGFTPVNIAGQNLADLLTGTYLESPLFFGEIPTGGD